MLAFSTLKKFRILIWNGFCFTTDSLY